MGRQPYNTTPRAPLPTLAVNARAYYQLQRLANRVVTKLTGNISFPTPTPSLATITTAVNTMTGYLSLTGGLSKRSRGSKANLVALRSAALNLHGLLNLELQYVLTVVGFPFSSGITTFLSSGYQVGELRTLSARGYQSPTFIAVPNNYTNSPGGILQVRFRKPRALRGVKLKGYSISNVTVPLTSGYPFFSSKTKFLVPNMPINTRWELKIQAFTAQGKVGVPFVVTVSSGNPV